MNTNSLGLYERLHMRHRRWRYAYKSEKPSIAFLQSLDLEGRNLIDIGANRGVYSWIMSECAGPAGNVLAFEPQPELNTHLQSLREAFGLQNLTIKCAGLSAASGTLQLQRPRVGAGQAGVNLPAGTFDDVIDVPVVTLDEYLADASFGSVDFIKTDVEGHEYEVFKGGEQTLAKHRPVMLFELYDREADRGDIFDLMSTLGYEGWFFKVEPDDHKNLLRNGRGTFVEYSKYKDHENVREGVTLRNYFFAHKDSTVCSQIQRLAGRQLASAGVCKT